MQQPRPFGRAIAMASLIAAAMGIANRGLRENALANIGPYVSRGKGRGKPFGKLHTHSTTFFPVKMRNGHRERARRITHMKAGTHGYNNWVCIDNAWRYVGTNAGQAAGNAP